MQKSTSLAMTLVMLPAAVLAGPAPAALRQLKAAEAARPAAPESEAMTLAGRAWADGDAQASATALRPGSAPSRMPASLTHGRGPSAAREVLPPSPQEPGYPGYENWKAAERRRSIWGWGGAILGAAGAGYGGALLGAAIGGLAGGIVGAVVLGMLGLFLGSLLGRGINYTVNGDDF